jgi:NhaA family Na+:H+ antiporter
MTRHSQSRPFERFFETEAAGGVLLLLSAAAALIAANSAWASEFNRFWSIPVTVGVSNHSLSLSLHQWIGDGLMAVFFLLMGLEIKREFVAGELSAADQAALPIAGAIGGMALPAAIYLLVNPGGIAARGCRMFLGQIDVSVRHRDRSSSPEPGDTACPRMNSRRSSHRPSA